jgi:hypothetical protein
VVHHTSTSLIYGQYLLFALRFRVVCTQPILGLTVIYRKILQCFLPFPFNRLSDLITPWRDSAFEGIWSHIESITTLPSIFASVSGRAHLRIVKDVNRDLLPRLIHGFTNVESPQKTRDADECSLLSECLTDTDPSTPTKCHISTFVRKWLLVWATLYESLWVELIRVWEIPLIPMDGPYISLHPSIFRYQPSLFKLSAALFQISRVLTSYISS